MPSDPLNLALSASSMHLSQALKVLRALLCLALAGCSSEVVPPIQSQAPRIVVQPSVVVTGNGARITATINPNRLDTDFYFEYGPSTAYGRQLETKFIQAALGDVEVGDNISNLAADTTYHCRLVAMNSAGTTRSDDRDFSIASIPPSIESETAVLVFRQMAYLTATVNAHYRQTECFFEYGLTPSYGMNTAPKSIGSEGTGVVVRDTVTGLAVDTLYHFRLLARNSAGTTLGADRTIMGSPSGPPVVSSEVAFAINGLKISGKVVPNGRETQCYFEYGPTTAYGSQLPARWVGAGFDTLLFVDTIEVVPPGTTMHFRLVAINANGRRESADKALKGFVYPLSAGTTWNYRYIYSFHYMTGEQTEKRGRQVWRSTGTGTENATTILLTRIDTTVTWFPIANTDTTTLITQVDTSFSIAVTPYSYDIQWYQFARFTTYPNLRGWFSIPRVAGAESDTVTIPEGRLQQSSFLRTYSVNGVGLISWQDYNGSNYRWNEQLILESFSP